MRRLLLALLCVAACGPTGIEITADAGAVDAGDGDTRACGHQGEVCCAPDASCVSGLACGGGSPGKCFR